MQIHYDLFRELCSSDDYIALSKQVNDKELIEHLLNKNNMYQASSLNEDSIDVVVSHWKDYVERKNIGKSFDEIYRMPLLHFSAVKSIEVCILGHKRKYVHCQVIDPIYKKRTRILRILKTKKTSHLQEGECYTLDLVEIKAGAIHEHNIFEIAEQIKINKGGRHEE